MSAITVDGELVHYEVLGRGRPVVMLHGWLGSWRYWIPTMQHLHMKYRVYAIDLFGFGDSGKNPRKYTVQHHIDMLNEFMEQLAIPRAAFIGHGLGAIILSEFAFQYQRERVPRLLLVSAPLYDIGGLANRTPVRVSQHNDIDPDRTIASSSMEATIPSAGMLRAALLERAATLNRESGSVGAVPLSGSSSMSMGGNPLAESIQTTELTIMLDKAFRRSESFYGKLQSDVLNTDNQILEKSIAEFDAAKMLDTVQQLQMPTVLIHGQEDPLIPAPNEAVWDYVTRGKEDSTIAIPLANVRHFPMIEHERFGSFVREFLETPDISSLEVKERWRRRSR